MQWEKVLRQPLVPSNLYSSFSVPKNSSSFVSRMNADPGCDSRVGTTVPRPLPDRLAPDTSTASAP